MRLQHLPNAAVLPFHFIVGGVAVLVHKSQDRECFSYNGEMNGRIYSEAILRRPGLTAR